MDYRTAHVMTPVLTDDDHDAQSRYRKSLQ